MRFSIKLFLSISLIIAIALACFCTAMVSYNYRLSMRQAYDDALLELRTIRMSLQIAIHTDGEKQAMASLNNQIWQVSYGKKLTLFDDQGQLLYSNNAERDMQGRYTIPSDQTGEMVSFGHGTDVGFYEFTASSCFTVGNSVYHLVIIQSADDILERLQNQLKIYQYMYVSLIAVVLFVLFVFSRLFTKPVRQLASSTRRLADGMLDERVEIKTSDEIGQLGRDFNLMAQSIQEKVEHLNQESSNKDLFIANFTHEIKTPMTSILGYADLIFQMPNISAELRAASEYILNESLRLESLSHKLMELYVLDKQDFIFTEMFMPDFLQELKLSMSTMLDSKGVSLILAADPAFTYIEPDLFVSMISNLIDNAVKAGATEITIHGHWNEEYYQIDIQDNGCGMDTTELPHIREAFYMVDKSRSRKQHGAGLGLALCEKIAQLHQTTLHFASTKGKGTLVSFSLREGRK